eukprot:6466587-Ditylum_brightwellii.AAC.1
MLLKKIGDGDDNCVLLKVGDTVDPDCVKTSSVPSNWMDSATNKKWHELDFNEVDNPGGWSSCSFKPMFEHVTSKRVQTKIQTAVFINIETGHFTILDEPFHQSGSDPIPPDTDRLFPPSCIGGLDADMLYK